MGELHRQNVSANLPFLKISIYENVYILILFYGNALQTVLLRTNAIIDRVVIKFSPKYTAGVPEVTSHFCKIIKPKL